jgi:hypothetical protein
VRQVRLSIGKESEIVLDIGGVKGTIDFEFPHEFLYFLILCLDLFILSLDALVQESHQFL